MNFIEILKGRAKAEAFRYGERWEEIEDVELGIDTTIKVLEEMIIKGPFPRLLKTDGERDTWIMNHDGSVMVHF